MLVINDAVAMRRFARTQRSGGRSVAFVPTMGALHDGHLELVREARRLADDVVLSIFVNPLQFGANEDFGKYPRTLAADCEKLQATGADIIFAPAVEEMYPDFDGKSLNQTMMVTPPPLAETLCGASRPGQRMRHGTRTPPRWSWPLRPRIPSL